MSEPVVTQAVVLGAGLGTRLRPMTHHLPKPGVPLLQRPVAAHAIDHLARAGVRDVAVNTHYLAPALEELLPKHVPLGVQLRFSREETLLGTGGGIRAAWAKLDPKAPLIVMNGDILFRPDLTAALRVHHARRALATMVVRAHPEAQRLGAIETDAHGQVVRLLGTPVERAASAEWMFTGVHVLAPEVFERLPVEGCIIRRGYRAWVDEGLPVHAVPSAAPFRDVGTHAEYLAAHLDALHEDAGRDAAGHDLAGQATAGRAVAPQATAGHDGPGQDAPHVPVHPDAHVHPSAVLTRSFVGAFARVDAGVRLHECVVWPETRVTESAERCLIGPFGVLPVR